MSARAPDTEDALDELLSVPRAQTVDALRHSPGDVLLLGAGGKMGPTLARMAARAAEVADGGTRRRVIAVSRFSSRPARESLEAHDVETISADLLDRAAVARLPDAPNVIYMAGQKFGTTEAPSRTWMMNVVAAAYCAERYAESRIVAFSTGNVYPLTPVADGGARESTEPRPVGEYAASCLGRERVFEHYSTSRGTRVAIIRLNYAIDLRYGVLTDLAARIRSGTPIPLGMGHVNVIWQGDANRIALELLPAADTPPFLLNVTGHEALSVRALATQLGKRLGVAPRFTGSEAGDALLSNTSRMQKQFAGPQVPLERMLDWVAEWVSTDKPLLGKPTHFEARDGAF
jgi:nucleoside-diphosphate-sugar epimerase